MNLDIHSAYEVSQHASRRMSSRGLSLDVIRRVVNFGRVAVVRGATIYAIGRKEVEWFQPDGPDLSDAEGVQVVCTGSGVIMTAYRNRNFRGLRPGSRSRSRRSK